MRRLADECCDMAVVRALRDAGHDVVSVRESSQGADDETVVRMAIRDERVLLTEDKDFGQLVHASAAKPPGVIFIRFPASARQAMAEAVLMLVRTHGEQLLERFAVVEPGRIRVSRRRENG